MDRRPIAFLFIVMLSTCLSTTAFGGLEESKKGVLFQLKSGESVRGDILYESELHYRIEKRDGVRDVIFKSDIMQMSGPKMGHIQEISECAQNLAAAMGNMFFIDAHLPGWPHRLLPLMKQRLGERYCKIEARTHVVLLQLKKRE